MKKYISFLLLLVFFLAPRVFAQTTVQGQFHPTAKHIPQTKTIETKSNTSFSFKDIKYWVGSGSNEAALMIEWHDGKNPDAIVWGFRWNGSATGHDMIVAIAKADPRLLLLTQQTGPMGYTICGLGYSDSKLNITYDLEGAKAHPEKNLFRFSEPFPTLSPQTSVPADPVGDAAAAIKNGLATGVIYHPFTQAKYGYCSYDYDFWKCDAGSGHWAAGWYYGYWSYFTRESHTEEFSYSGLGSTSRILNNGSWDAWSWNGDMTTMEGTTPGDVFVAATDPSTSPKPSDPTDQTIHVSSVTLSNTSLNLHTGEQSTLTATVLPASATDKSVSWNSSDEHIATVKDGVVNALNPGDVTITAQSNDSGIKAVCNIHILLTVIPELSEEGTTPVLSFTPSNEATSYEIHIYKHQGNTIQKIKIYSLDANGNIISDIDTKASSERIRVPMKGLTLNGIYTFEVRVMKDLSLYDTYKLEKTSFVTASNLIETTAPQAFYVKGSLYIDNMEGYQINLYTIAGVCRASFIATSTHEMHPVQLSTGLYLLVGNNKSNKQSFKIQVNH